jgi:hypothetical protein
VSKQQVQAGMQIPQWTAHTVLVLMKLLLRQHLLLLLAMRHARCRLSSSSSKDRNNSRNTTPLC